MEYSKLQFKKRADYYEAFIYYTKTPHEHYEPTGVKIAHNHLNTTKKGKTISSRHPNYDEDIKTIREKKQKIESIVEKYVESYGEKPPTKYVVEQSLKPFEVEKKKLDELLDYYPGFLKYKRKFVSSDESLQPYNSLKKAFEQFERDKNVKLTFSNLDYDFYYEFLNFMINERYDERLKNIAKEKKGLNNNTTKKRISYLTAFLKYCINVEDINLNLEKQKTIIQTATAALEIKSYEVNNNNLSLNIHEILELHDWKDCPEEYKEDKDYNVLQLLTGMRISDTKSIDEHEVEIREGFLVKHSEKTNAEFAVRLRNIAKEILVRYNYKINITESKYNEALKKIYEKFFEYYKPIYEKILGQKYKMNKIIIEKKGKKLTKTSVPKHELASSKVGRVSYISEQTSNKELSLKEIMQATGHTKIATVQKYMDMSESISREDLNKLLKARGYDLSKI